MMSDAESKGDVVDQLAEEFLARYRRGERPAVQDYADRYPEHAVQIRDLFPALVALERVAPAGDSESVRPGAAQAGIASGSLPQQVGDYRIVRQIGRGGMGIVYEAEQEALGRRVALKVLLGPAAQDAKLLARFRRESRTAAQLHHTNIVPVFDVGQQGNLCYYAMQFIRGQALDEVFRELQRLRAGSKPGLAKEAAAPAGFLAQSLWTGKYEPAAASGTVDHEPAPTPAVEPVPGPAETTAAALPDHSELSSVASNYQRYCRNVARLGLQATEALAYAHAHGIIHRDIKPANLLLDTSGVLWVSDFGLVKTQDPALTDTGDLVGTLRYMAPERFRGECDALADVYALGLTLYELLVLRPAFDGKDRLHLAEQIGHQEPARLRALDPRIPRDLETILMKAIEKDPRRRYTSAADMAEDLRRYLADEPIKARRIGPLERLGRWGRRNPLVAGLSAAVVLIAAIGFAGVFGQMQVAQANERQAEQQKQEAKNERDEAQKQRDEVKALADKLAAKEQQLQRTLYAAHMNLAQHAWDAGSIGRADELLEQHRPKPGETDLRGFEWNYLNRLCHADAPFTMKERMPFLNTATFSPDGKRLVTNHAGGGNTGVNPELKFWDARTGQELFTLKGHTQHISGRVFSPDGKRLASTSGDGTVKVWDAETGQQILNIKGHTAYVHSVAFSPDGKRLASASSDKSAKVWDAQTGQELFSLKGFTAEVYSVAFSPDGKRLASGSPVRLGSRSELSLGEVKVWDAQTGQELTNLNEQSDTTMNFAFSPDCKRLAIAGQRSKIPRIKVCDTETGREIFTFQRHSDEVTSLAFSPDSKQLASGSRDKTVRIWDLQTGQEIRTLKGHTDTVYSVAFSPDGKRLASASGDRSVKVWDVQAGHELSATKGRFYSVAFSPDGKRLASGSYLYYRDTLEPEVKIWDARSGQQTLILRGHTSSILCVAFSPDGKRLASGAGVELKVWDAETGQELLTLKNAGYSIVFSPDGKRLASGAGVELKVWDAQTGQEIQTLKGHTADVRSVAFSPDGKRLASASPDGTVKVWDAQTGQELLTFKGHTDEVTSVVFSPDGKRLASSGYWDPTVKVWDAQTGQEFLALKGHTDSVTSLAFSPDGKRLASASGDQTVKLWDAQTGQELLTLKGAHGVAFSPDGHRVAGAGDEGLKIWNATPLPENP